MKHLFKALADFSHEVPAIHQASQGYGYTYSSLSDILKVINPLLDKHGLGMTQIPEGDKLRTIIFHVESGESIEGHLDIPQDVQLRGMNTLQSMGASISYLRRYSLSMLNLVTDSDIDAGREETTSKKSRPTLTKERLEKAIESIDRGEFDVEKLKEDFSLTPKQLERVDSYFNITPEKVEESPQPKKATPKKAKK